METVKYLHNPAWFGTIELVMNMSKNERDLEINKKRG